MLCTRLTDKCSDFLEKWCAASLKQVLQEISGSCCIDSKLERHESNLYYNTLLLSVVPRPNLEKQKEGLVF